MPLLQLVLAEGAGSAFGGVMPIVLMFAVVEIADKVKIRVLRKDIVDAATAALADDKKPAAKDAKEEDKAEAKPVEKADA